MSFISLIAYIFIQLLVSFSTNIYGFMISSYSSSSTMTMMTKAINYPFVKSSLIIAGPSGVGKGTLIQSLLTTFPDKIALSVSQTTRAPRQGEINGYHYEFISPSTLTGLSDIELKQRYMEYTHVHGNFYGTSKDAMLRIHKEGKLCILDIDSNGVRQVKDILDQKKPPLDNSAASDDEICKFLFIAPPSFDDLERRLRGRGTENEQQIQTRLKNAVKEMDYGTNNNFDKILLNENFDVLRQDCLKTLNLWFPHLQLSL